MAYDKDKIFPLILSEIEEGASLRSICKREDMPSRTLFFEWLKDDEEKANQYARACEARADSIFDEIIEISDHSEEDHTPFTGSNIIQRDRLKIDARKWMLGKMNPKKYGDKIQQEHSGELTTNIISLGSGIKPDESNN